MRLLSGSAGGEVQGAEPEPGDGGERAAGRQESGSEAAGRGGCRLLLLLLLCSSGKDPSDPIFL